MEKINLLCIPYSGGSKYSLMPLVKHAPRGLNPVVMEFPGRGTRSTEKLCDDIHLLAHDLYLQALPFINEPYAIYGHSMGGLLTYLLTKLIISYQLPEPLHLFITGTTGPSVKNFDKKNHLLEKEAFIEKIDSLGGMPDEIIRNPEMMEYFERIMRSDFRAAENYIHEPSEPFDIPISVIIGDKEDMKHDDVKAWSRVSNSKVDVSILPGNHFFIFDHALKIMDYFLLKVTGEIKSNKPSSLRAIVI
jgi:surfactin synthase thioesterase subunit